MNLTKRHLICALGLCLPLFFYYVKNKATTCVHSMWSASLLKRQYISRPSTMSSIYFEIAYGFFNSYLCHYLKLQTKFIKHLVYLKLGNIKNTMQVFNFLTDWAIFGSILIFFQFSQCILLLRVSFSCFHGQNTCKIRVSKN